jgi:ferritin
MLNKNVENILNVQVEKEAYSSSLYLAMASWAETEGMEGIAQWLYEQSDEERMHMLKLVKYINERGGNALIPALKEPPKTFGTVQEMFQQVLKHEEFITASINEIVALCVVEKDFTTHSWVQWFVNEQIEEEANATRILDKLKLLGGKNLYMFDRDIMSMRSEETEDSSGDTT